MTVGVNESEMHSFGFLGYADPDFTSFLLVPGTIQSVTRSYCHYFKSHSEFFLFEVDVGHKGGAGGLCAP